MDYMSLQMNFPARATPSRRKQHQPARKHNETMPDFAVMKIPGEMS
jgi:hypothetical protein